MREAGYYVDRQAYEVAGKTYQNFATEREGLDQAIQVVIVAVHYDSVVGSPSDNDNPTGVATLLALVWTYQARRPWSSRRFVAFANEDLFSFQVPTMMGSFIYARCCRQRQPKVSVSVQPVPPDHR